MTQQKFKKAVDVLMTEKNKIDAKLTEIQDRFIRWKTELDNKRHEQFGYREAKEAMSGTASNKAARKVFDDQIAQCQIRIEDVLKELDQVEKDREVWGSKSKGIEKSIREIQNA